MLLVFIVHQLFRPVDRVRKLPPKVKRHPAVVLPLSGFLLLVVLLMPLGFVGFVPQVVALIALYVLMGLGLNITLGLAGLLDLGFVAFFAVGAYTVGLLTSTGEFGIAQWPFWAAIPFAIVAAMLFGIVLGLPILGIRGDYLAIATLAFGEIIRLMVGREIGDLFMPPRSLQSPPWLLGCQGLQLLRYLNDRAQRPSARTQRQSQRYGQQDDDCRAYPCVLRYQLHALAHFSVPGSATSDRRDGERLAIRPDESRDPVGFFPACIGLCALVASLRCGELIIDRTATTCVANPRGHVFCGAHYVRFVTAKIPHPPRWGAGD